MTVAATSIEAYHDTTDERLTSAQRVLRYLRREVGRYQTRAASRGQIAKALGMEKSSVSGRVNELIKEGKAQEVGTMRCPLNGRTVKAVYATL